MKNKFVLVDNEIIAGRVAFHKELHKSPLGGGWWYYHTEQNKLILYGDSHDFGPISEEQIKDAELSGSFRNLENVEIVFDSRHHTEKLSILKDHLGIVEGTKVVSECDWI